MDEFRYEAASLQAMLRSLHELLGVPFRTTAEGALRIEDPAQESLADQIQCTVRTWRFPQWYLLCLRDGRQDDGRFARRCLAWFAANGVPYELEHHGEETWALLPEGVEVPEAFDDPRTPSDSGS